MTSVGRFLSRGRVSPRRATHFLCFAKESKQRKATPTVCVPPLRCGQPAVLDSGGGPQNSLRSNSCGPDPASICAPRRSQKGWERAAFALARLQQPMPTALIPTTAARSAAVASRPSEAKARVVCPPLCMRRGAGSPFFCLRFFGEAKKSRSPAGATPGLGKQAPVCAETGASQ